MKKYEMYFISNDYFNKFQDNNLMKNKGDLSNKKNGRPCYYCFKDKNNKDIYWMIPFSNQVAKYQKIANKKIAKRGYCDTILFGTFLGKPNAFLIQNMCPCTKKYLIPYIDKNNQPIKLKHSISVDLEKNANNILTQVSKGVKVVFPDIKKIYNELENELEKEKEPLDLKALKKEADEYNKSRVASLGDKVKLKM